MRVAVVKDGEVNADTFDLQEQMMEKEKQS